MRLVLHAGRTALVADAQTRRRLGEADRPGSVLLLRHGCEPAWVPAEECVEVEPERTIEDTIAWAIESEGA